MKANKIFTAVLLALMMLTMTSCSAYLGELAKKPEDPALDEPPEASVPEAPPDGQDPAPAEDGAGYRPQALAHFTVFPEGDYLEERFRTSDPLPGYDFVPGFRGSWASGAPTSCATDTTYYYKVKADGWMDMLYYMDKATGISGPLCGKPECSHNDSTCNAYMSPRGCYGLSLYDGRIWWIYRTIGAEIHSCALDGTDHRLERKISRDLVDSGGVPDIYFHRGTMYWMETDNEIVDGKLVMLEDMIAFPLDGGDPYYVYKAHPAVGDGFPFLFFLRDKILFFFDPTVCYYAEDDVTVLDWDASTEIYLYDLNTRQVETLFAGETDFFMGGRWPYLKEDGIYFLGASSIEDGRWVSEDRFLPWGGDTFERMEHEYWYDYNFDGRFIDFDLSGNQLSILEYALDGRHILDRSFKVTYTGNPLLQSLQGWDEDYYYLQLPSVQVAVATDAHALYYLDGTQTDG